MRAGVLRLILDNALQHFDGLVRLASGKFQAGIEVARGQILLVLFVDRLDEFIGLFQLADIHIKIDELIASNGGRRI
jgi:hypothetical protein